MPTILISGRDRLSRKKARRFTPSARAIDRPAFDDWLEPANAGARAKLHHLRTPQSWSQSSASRLWRYDKGRESMAEQAVGARMPATDVAACQEPAQRSLGLTEHAESCPLPLPIIVADEKPLFFVVPANDRPGLATPCAVNPTSHVKRENAAREPRGYRFALLLKIDLVLREGRFDTPVRAQFCWTVDRAADAPLARLPETICQWTTEPAFREGARWGHFSGCRDTHHRSRCRRMCCLRKIWG
jgi:hypothetical protein